MFDDDAARRALGTLTDEPAPPVATTTLDQVLRRGRRRVFAQRAGAVAGVMAVVAAIGVSAVLLRPGDEQGGMHIADSTTPPTPRSTVTEPPSSVPPPRMPGWEQTEFPAGTRSCQQPFHSLPPEPQIGILPQDVVEPAFVAAVSAATGHQPVVTMAEWEGDSPKAVGPRGYVGTQVPMTGGTGEVQLEVLRYGGTPIQMADASLTTYGNCVPPLRKVLTDGTVMQLYPGNVGSPSSPPVQTVRPLQIYRPDNRMYVVTAAGHEAVGTPDGGGLPLSEEQLAEVAARLVVNLD